MIGANDKMHHPHKPKLRDKNDVHLSKKSSTKVEAFMGTEKCTQSCEGEVIRMRSTRSMPTANTWASRVEREKSIE
jgi:hypothetical protein